MAAKGKSETPKNVAIKPPTLDDIPDLIKTMLEEKGEKRAAATKRIYELCDVSHKQNRIPMVTSGGQYDVLPALARCLTQDSGDGLHLACLALNNLSIPPENKLVMALGPTSREVIGGLCKVIKEDKQFSYMCCICLMNLSFLEAGINSILTYSESGVPCLEDNNSLLRVLERLLVNSPSTLKAGIGSGKSECVRWACGLIKNLTKSEENAKLIGKTQIPRCVVDNIKNSSSPPSRWTSNSLEDFSLFVILNLSQWPGSKDALVSAGALDAIQSIMAEGDLQGLKATMACAFLDAPWSEFPENGTPAANAVSELMTNITEKKGKDGQYAYGVFKMYTATKAYRDLATSAANAGNKDSMKALATPSTVALCWQVISDLILAASDDTENGSKFIPDSTSAEYACQAIEKLLPAILQPAEPARKSPATDKACKELQQMLVKYANTNGTSGKAQEAAKKAASQIEAGVGTARPVLEISHDLWTQYRKREGQPMDQYLSQDQGIEADESGPLDFLPCVGKSGESSCLIL